MPTFSSKTKGPLVYRWGGRSVPSNTQSVIVVGLFDAADQHEAMAEGWFLGFDPSSNVYDILDNLTLTFSTPAEARAYVEKRADAGSSLHERALAATVALTIRNAGKTK